MACELRLPWLEPGDTPEWRLGLPVLTAPGVTLREPRLSDAASLCEMLATDAVARHMSRPPASTAGFAQFIAWIQAERLAGRCLCFAIVPDGQTNAVGLIQVRQVEPGFGTAEWGFALGRPYWGTGLFPKIARLAIDFVFREVRVHRLEARVAVGNARASGVLVKLGAVPEGVLRQSLIRHPQRLDQVLWSLLAEDWLAWRPAPLYRRLAARPAMPETVHAQQAPDAGETPAWRRGLPTLRGRDLLVRPLALADARPLARLLTTGEVVRFILPPPNTVEGFEQFIRWSHDRWEAGWHASFGVVPGGLDHAVGVFQVQQIDSGFRTAEWGFAIGEPFWGTGLFAEAAGLVLDFAFDTLGVRRLEARTAMANGRGNGALRKVGAVREALLRRSFLLGSGCSDDFLWSILDGDWRRHRDAARL